MASFAPIRDTRENIQNTPIVDGQILFETNMGSANKIYIDVGSTRSQIGGTGANNLYELDDVSISNESEKQVLQLIDENGTLKWENKGSLDEWLSDSNGIIYKTLDYGTISVSYTQAELAPVINGGYSVDPYVECADGVAPPLLINMVYDTSSSTNYLTIKYTTITSAQAGGTSGTSCRIKLRIMK